MSASDEDPAEIERAYRRALFKVILHLGYVFLLCIGAFAIRKAFGLPPAFLTIVLVLALVLFSPEIFRFMRLRNELQRLERLRERES